MKIQWCHDSCCNELYFEDLNLKDTFHIHGHNAVYMKVQVGRASKQYMLEVETGLLWPPTESQLVMVDSILNVDQPKPPIYQ